MTMPPLALLCAVARITAAEPVPDTLQLFTAYRAALMTEVERVRAACGQEGAENAQTGLRVRVHVGPDGQVTPTLLTLRLPKTAHLTDAERTAAYAATEALEQCFVTRVGEVRLAPPPGGRGITFDLQVEIGRGNPAGGVEDKRAPAFDPMDRASPEYQRGLVEVVWHGESAIFACLGPASRTRPLPVRWVIDPLGQVMAVDDPPSWLPPDEARCVIREIQHWKFPRAPGVTGPWPVVYAFDGAGRSDGGG